MSDPVVDALLNSVRQPNIDAIATELGVRPELARAVMRQESGGNPNAVSKKGAIGAMQVLPSTAANPGFGVKPFDPNDPEQNMRGGLSYLKALLDHHGGNEKLALAAYNAGEGAVQKAGNDVPNFPETQNYVKSVEANAGSSPRSDVDALLDSVRGPAPEEKSLAGFGHNVVSSGKNFAKGLYDVAAHPFDTGENLLKVGVGAVQKVAPAIGGPWMRDYTPYANAVGDFYKKRYGGLDAIGNTLYNDPVGAAADLASVLGGAEMLPGRVGKFAAVARAAVDPVSVVGKLGSKIAAPIVNPLAEHLVNANLQVPKAMRRREMRPGGVPHAEAVLETGRGTNPFTRLSEGGEANAIRKGNEQQAIKAILRDADEAAGHKYDPSTIDKAMAEQAPYWSNDPTASQSNLNIIEGKRDNFRNNPHYSQDKMGVVPVQQQVRIPSPTGAVDNAGNPIMQTVSQTVMQPQVVGREFRPVGANQLEAAKGPVYQRQAGNYGPGRDAVGDAVDKAAASAADKILDTNIPGYDKANKVHQQAEVARKALQEAILSRQTKRKGGLAEAMTYAAPILAGEGHMYLGLGAAALGGYNTIVKHPWLTSPVASALWNAGHFQPPKWLTPTANTNKAVNSNDNKANPLTKSFIDEEWEKLLASKAK